MSDKDGDPLEQAFTAAQGELKDAVFNRVNPHFRSKYADRSAVGRATKPALMANGLNIRHRLGMVDGLGYCVITKLSHVSGKYEESFLAYKWINPQQRGSDVTYGCRYNVSALCNIASEEDDDANEAEREPTTPKTKAVAREEKNYEALVSLLGETTTQKEVDAFIGSYRVQIDELPTDWKNTFREDCRRHRAGLAE